MEIVQQALIFRVEIRNHRSRILKHLIDLGCRIVSFQAFPGQPWQITEEFIVVVEGARELIESLEGPATLGFEDDEHPKKYNLPALK